MEELLELETHLFVWMNDTEWVLICNVALIADPFPAFGSCLLVVLVSVIDHLASFYLLIASTVLLMAFLRE